MKGGEIIYIPRFKFLCQNNGHVVIEARTKKEAYKKAVLLCGSVRKYKSLKVMPIIESIEG